MWQLLRRWAAVSPPGPAGKACFLHESTRPGATFLHHNLWKELKFLLDIFVPPSHPDTAPITALLISVHFVGFRRKHNNKNGYFGGQTLYFCGSSDLRDFLLWKLRSERSGGLICAPPQLRSKLRPVKPGAAGGSRDTSPGPTAGKFGGFHNTGATMALRAFSAKATNNANKPQTQPPSSANAAHGPCRSPGAASPSNSALRPLPT